MAPRLITKKQTRKINVPLAQFHFFLGGDAKSGVGVTLCVRTVARVRSYPTCASDARARNAREVREVKCKKGGGAHALRGLGGGEMSCSCGGRYFSSNLAPPPRPLLAPSTAARFWRFEARWIATPATDRRLGHQRSQGASPLLSVTPPPL